MSICVCPVADGGGITSSQHKEFVETFLRNLGEPARWNWSLMELKELAKNGNSIEDIKTVIPFRGGPCKRTTRCCSVCTRRCKQRCIQDCLTRLFMWKQTVQSTPELERDKLPLNIRMIAAQKFETWDELSWAVGDIVSKYTNPTLKEYEYAEHPYKLNYEPAIELDEHGKERADPISGKFSLVEWPESGLCPFCLPRRIYNGYIIRDNARKEKQAVTLPVKRKSRSK